MHSNKLSIFRYVHLGDRLLSPDPTRTLKWSHWFLPVKFNKPMLLRISVDTSVVFDSVECTIFKILPLLVIDMTALLFLLCDRSSFPSAESSSLSPYLHVLLCVPYWTWIHSCPVSDSHVLSYWYILWCQALSSQYRVYYLEP